MKKLLLLFLFLPSFASAAVAFDGTASTATTDHYPTNDITSISTTHTASGSNREAVACVSTRYGGGSSLPTSMACTYDAGATNQVMTSLGQVGGSNVSAVQMFVLASPVTTGSATITCTWSGAQAIAVLGVTSYTGVTLGAGSPQTQNSGSSQHPAITVSSNAANQVQDCIATSGGHPITGTKTQDWNSENAADAGGGAGQHSAGGASVTMQWDLTAADQTSMIAVDLESVAVNASTFFQMFFGAFSF